MLQKPRMEIMACYLQQKHKMCGTFVSQCSENNRFCIFKEYFGDEAVKKLKEIKYGPQQKNYTSKNLQPNSTGATNTRATAALVPVCAQGTCKDVSSKVKVML